MRQAPRSSCPVMLKPPPGGGGRCYPGFSAPWLFDPVFQEWFKGCVEHLLHCGHLDERLSRVMSMAFCSQALHQRSVGVQLGEVVPLRFGLGFRFPFFRLAGHSSSWDSSWAGRLPPSDCSPFYVLFRPFASFSPGSACRRSGAPPGTFSGYPGWYPWSDRRRPPTAR